MIYGGRLELSDVSRIALSRGQDKRVWVRADRTDAQGPCLPLAAGLDPEALTLSATAASSKVASSSSDPDLQHGLEEKTGGRETARGNTVDWGDTSAGLVLRSGSDRATLVCSYQRCSTRDSSWSYLTSTKR